MRRPVQTHSGAPAEVDSLASASLIFLDCLGGLLLRGLFGCLLIVRGFVLGLLLALPLFGRLLLARRLLGRKRG